MRFPAIASFALLAFQVAIPWTVNYLVTQDGSSHLYTAVVARDLLFHPQAPPYTSVYILQGGILPNWTTTILLALFTTMFGPDRAEQVLMTLCILAGFFSFSYAVRALAPRGSPWSPVTNFVFQTWFLWLGFYNFYLGMALALLVVGFYIRHIDRLGVRSAFVLALGLVAIFFTHLIPAALAVIALIVISTWVHLIAPLSLRTGLRKTAMLAVALFPALALMTVFTLGRNEPLEFKPEILTALETFPVQVFAVGRGRTAEQDILWPAVLFYIVLAALVMRRREWRGPPGAMAIAALAAFGLYLLVPGHGFGGTDAKIRFAWAVFLFGALVACSAERLRPFRTPAAVYVTFFLACNLTTTARLAHATSNAVEAYLAAADRIPPQSKFIRMRYPTPAAEARFGTNTLARDPFLHLDAWAAVRRHAVDVADYQASSGVFPVIFRGRMGAPERYTLWSLEGPGNLGGKSLAWLRTALPFRVDSVLLVGEEKSAEAAQTDMPRVLQDLNSSMHLLAATPGTPFVRVYGAVR